jgi:hypothetical protein
MCPAAAAAVARITAVTGAGPVLLTGDNIRAARRLAAQVGIHDVRAGLLPREKAQAKADLEAGGQRGGGLARSCAALALSCRPAPRRRIARRCPGSPGCA